MPGPSVSAMSLVIRLGRGVRTSLDQRFEAFGLTSQQAGALVHIFTGETSPRRLADLLGTDTAGMTRLIDRLEAKGLVERRADPRDRRALVVALTDQGRATIPSIPPVFDEAGAALAAGITAAELRSAVRVLEVMLGNLAGHDRS